MTTSDSEPERVATGPSVPWLGTFAETNVRLYAVDGYGRRGVVFRSLDASRLWVVLGARATFGLPYCWARMRIRRVGTDIEYTTTRRWPGRGVGAQLVVRPERARSLAAAHSDRSAPR